MALSVHDNYLVSYEVFSEQRRIVLLTEYRDGRTVPETTRVVFTDVEAYHFERDCFSNVLFDVETVPVERILADYADEIVAAARFVTWPWVNDLEKAPEALHAKGVQGFLIDSTVGLCGWVLARSGVFVPTPSAVVAPATPRRPGIIARDTFGRTLALPGQTLTAALGDGRELEFTLPQPGGQLDSVSVRATFNGPGGDAQYEGGQGPRPEIWGAVVLHPGAGNVLSLDVEGRSSTDGHVVVGPRREEPALPKPWFFFADGRRQPIQAQGFVLDLGDGRKLTLDDPRHGRIQGSVRVVAGEMPTNEEMQRFQQTGKLLFTPMSVSFGGSNALSIRLGKPFETQAMERVAARPTT